MSQLPFRNSAADIMMMRPAQFQSNPETAASNRFQSRSPLRGAVAAQARTEFERVVEALSAAGVRVHVFDDTPEPVKPDAVFPNNWVSFHGDGSLAIYPMMARSRRAERRLDVLSELIARGGFRVTRFVDLTHHELEHRYLEGTGSLVLDRIHRVAYACESPRTDAAIATEFSRLFGYELVLFEALDTTGKPVYHTNVVMALGTSFAAVCLEAISGQERASVCDRLERSGREVIALSLAQISAFAGNMIELCTGGGSTIVAMSEQAYQALDAGQRAALERLAGSIVAVPIPTIECGGGGSVRCMIAEVRLPLAS
jgi:hypothetical protein